MVNPEESNEHQPEDSGSSNIDPELEELNAEFAELADTPDMQTLAKSVVRTHEIRSGMDEVLRAEEDDPERKSAIESARELKVFLEQIEAQALSLSNERSRFTEIGSRMQERIDRVVYQRLGDKMFDIDDWLTSPRIVSQHTDQQTGEYFKIKQSLPSPYNGIDISAGAGRERVHYHGADFHGERSHRFSYYLDLSDKGVEDDYTSVRVETRYHTDTEGLLKETTKPKVKVYWVDKGGGRVVEEFTDEQAQALIVWLERKAEPIIEEQFNPTVDNSVIIARDFSRAYQYNYRERRLEDLDLDNQRRNILEYRNSKK